MISRMMVITFAVLIGLGSPPAHAIDPQPGPGSYTIEQAISDQAQLNTIAFDALGFITGSLGADSFFPPGKVADFWGFQSLRDNDPSGMGHSTDFLTKASLNMLAVLTAEQRARLLELAKSQVAEINEYGYDRFVLMTAFRRLLAGDLPDGTTGLDEAAVKAYSAELYRLDGQMSLERAAVMGPILSTLTGAQRERLDTMVGKGMTTWPEAPEPADLRGLDHDTKVAVMTYAGDMFSWYAGGIEQDVYFCPERQATYFGSFYLKDAPAVGNPGYSIGTNITGDMGKALLKTLTPQQASVITRLIEEQRSTLNDIVSVRRQVAQQLRAHLSGGSADSAAVRALMSRYGADDGVLIARYATAFARVSATLTEGQRAALMALRAQLLGSFAPAAAYLYSEPIAAPVVRNTDFLFGNATLTAVRPTILMIADRTTVRRGVTVTLTIRTAGDVAGGTAVITASAPGHRSTVLRRLPLRGAGTASMRFTAEHTVKLVARLRGLPSGSTATSPVITVTVRQASERMVEQG